MPDFDAGAFAERAAILEYDAGMTRFRAETLAARAEGVSRWEALRHEADSIGHPARAGHHGPRADRDAADDVPAMQHTQAQEDRSVPERDVRAGRGGGALLALQLGHGEEV